MSTFIQETLSKGVERRDFFKGLGALGVGLWGGSTSWAEDALETLGPVQESPAACRLALWSTDRLARNETPVQVLQCTPCDCPPFGQRNFLLKTKVTTFFNPLPPCDELFQIPPGSLIQWTFSKQEIRLIGPCPERPLPIGSYKGKWSLASPDGRPLFKGKFSGTIGFDVCVDFNAPACCAFPKVMGAMTGKGVDREFLDCEARWVFSGVEPFEDTQELCRPIEWFVKIAGMVICPCPEG